MTDPRGAGMGVSYDGTGSALLTESEQGFWKAGRRCPDLVLHQRDCNDEIRLYSTVAYGQFSILSIGGPLNQRWSNLSVSMARYAVLPADQEANDAGELTFRSPDVQPDEHFVAVVRPDMYIGFVGTEDDAVSYLSKTVIGLRE